MEYLGRKQFPKEGNQKRLENMKKAEKVLIDEKVQEERILKKAMPEAEWMSRRKQILSIQQMTGK